MSSEEEQREECSRNNRMGKHYRTTPNDTWGKDPACNAGDKRRGFDPWSGRSPGGGHGNPLKYSCLENPMDREAWWATVHRVA